MAVLLISVCVLAIISPGVAKSNYIIEEFIQGKWDQLADGSAFCDVSDDQWKLIAWYLNRVSHIDVTHLVREVSLSRQSKFANFFLKDLFEKTGIEYRTSQVDYR